MSLINTQVKAFNATAYHSGQFIDVSEQDFIGKWSVVYFYPADFTFVCPTEVADLADQYANLKKWVWKFIQYLQTHTLPIKHGTTPQKKLKKFNIQ